MKKEKIIFYYWELKQSNEIGRYFHLAHDIRKDFEVFSSDILEFDNKYKTLNLDEVQKYLDTTYNNKPSNNVYTESDYQFTYQEIDLNNYFKIDDIKVKVMKLVKDLQEKLRTTTEDVDIHEIELILAFRSGQMNVLDDIKEN